MSRKNFVTFIVAAVAVLAAVFAVLLLITPRPRYVSISYNQALREMPEVQITDPEFEALRAAREEIVVQEALGMPVLSGETRKVELPLANAQALFAGIVPLGAEFGDFAVIEDTMYIDFKRGNDRIIFECLPDSRVKKTIARYEDIENPGQGKVLVYTSNNNNTYQKY